MVAVLANQTRKTASEQRIYDMVNSINHKNWEEYVSYASEDTYDTDKRYFTNEENEKNHLGLFNVKSVEMDEIYPVELEKAAAYTGYDIAGKPSEFAAYFVCWNCSVHQDAKYFKNGENYFFILLRNENNEWKRVQFSGADPEWLGDAKKALLTAVV